MITQIPVSVKLDINTLSELERECSASGMRRNRVINIACVKYCQLRDLWRRHRLGAASLEDIFNYLNANL